MADRITITTSELRTSGDKFQQRAAEIREILDFLRQEVNNLESSWDGAAQDKFFIAYEELQTPLNQFPEVLDGISKQLITIADTIEETDQALADSIG